MTQNDCRGNPCPRQEVMFACQCLILFTSIAVSLYNFFITTPEVCSKEALWATLISGCLGICCPRRVIKWSTKKKRSTVKSMTENFKRMGSVVMTFPSNASMNLYLLNKASDYRVQLPALLRLEGDWEVGLTGFHYSRTWFNVPRDETYTLRIISGIQDKPICIASLPLGHYSSPRKLIKALRDDECSRLVHIDYSEQDQRVTFIICSAWGLEVNMLGGLAQKLGWAHQEVSFHLNTERDQIKAPGAMNLDDLDMIFVNCDLAADSHYVGDRMVPLLKTISP